MPQRLTSSVNNLKTLISLTGTNDKLDFIASLNKNSDTDTLYLLKVLLSNEYILGIKKLQPIGLCNPVNKTSYESVETLIERLNVSNINKSIKHDINALLKECDKSAQDILIALLQKTLKIGITSSSINKIIPNFIPDFKVMLADTADFDTFTYPVRVDVKYDGVRCIAKIKDGNITLYTRQGKILKFPRIEKEIKQLASKLDIDYCFDGELETISNARTDVSGICSSNIHTGYDGIGDTFMKYTIFDIIPTDVFESRGKTDVLSTRAKLLSSIFLTHTSKQVFETKYHLCNTEQEVRDLTNSLINLGYEGTIIKDLNAKYVFKRNSAWIKQKAINSVSLLITGVTEGTNKRFGHVGALICESSDKKLLVKVGSGMTDEDIELWTKHSPIGQIAEVLFNVVIKGPSDDVYSLFLPRLAPAKIRIDKDEADSFDDIMKQHIGKPEI